MRQEKPLSSHDQRVAARIATLVALPVTVVAGALIAGLLVSSGPADSGAVNNTPTVPAATNTPPAWPVPPPPEDLAACERLMAALPETIAGAPRSPAAPPGTAAYGTPAITVSCGGPATTFPPMGMLWPLGGVCWYGAQRPGETVFSTVDRETPVRVTIPSLYEGQLIAEFSPAVSTQPARPEVPKACG